MKVLAYLVDGHRVTFLSKHVTVFLGETFLFLVNITKHGPAWRDEKLSLGFDKLSPHRCHLHSFTQVIKH